MILATISYILIVIKISGNRNLQFYLIARDSSCFIANNALIVFWYRVPTAFSRRIEYAGEDNSRRVHRRCRRFPGLPLSRQEKLICI